MSAVAAIPVFVVGLVVTLVAAATFARRLDRLGAKHGLSEVWIGLLTALAADGPEIASALIALIKGATEASVGVILGSNIFNLAAMVGASVVIAGVVRIPRRALLLEGTVAVAVTAVVFALLLGAISAAAAIAVIACVLGAYLVLGLGPIARRVLSGDDGQHAPRSERQDTQFATGRQVALMLVDLALIIAGSYGMVESALTLGRHWGLATGIIGALVLAPLTSLPNVLTGVRLGSAGRGAALVTEALNSNTINLVAGIAIPSLAVTIAARTTQEEIALALLAAATLVTLASLATSAGANRRRAILLLVLYAAFVVTTIAH